MATRRQDTEEYLEAMARARAIRAEVADAIATTIKDGDRMSSRTEVGERVQLIVDIERRLMQARGQEAQARDVGTPIGPSIAIQREQRDLLLEAVMGAAVTLGQWAAALILERKGGRNG